ncbi:MAG: signal recognition particle-docking protein FtsY [Methanobacteriota archaeon]
MFNFLKEKLGLIKNEASADKDLIVEQGGFWSIKESKLEDVLWALEVSLMEADVAVEVIAEIKDSLKKELVGKKLAWGANIGEAVEGALRKSVTSLLSRQSFDFDQFVAGHARPVVVMFVGVNGTGKTTAIAKVANRLKSQKMGCVLAAGDTFRAGAIEQLSLHADKLGVKVIKHLAGSDPAAVAYDAIEHARARNKDIVLIDTAGRMQTNANLMDELKKVKRVAEPHLVIFVGDSLAGNDAIEQAKAFDAAVGINAVILTKIDADSKGGAALSIAHAIRKPIAFVSTGQEYDQFQKFDAEWMAKRIFE